MCGFTKVWFDLRKKLKNGTVIQNWTAYNGYLGDEMTIVEVGRDFIVFKVPNAKNLQNVPKEELEKVWDVWKDYKTQKVRRYELKPMTRHSKYIISLLHWYEEEGKL